MYQPATSRAADCARSRRAALHAFARVGLQARSIQDVDASPEVRDGALGAQLVEPHGDRVTRPAHHLRQHVVRDLQRGLAALLRHHQQPPCETLAMGVEAGAGHEARDLDELTADVREHLRPQRFVLVEDTAQRLHGKAVPRRLEERDDAMRMARNGDQAADAEQTFGADKGHRDLVAGPHVADPAERPRVGEEGNRHRFPGSGKRLPRGHDDVFRFGEEYSPFTLGQLGKQTIFQGALRMLIPGSGNRRMPPAYAMRRYRHVHA